MKNLVMVFLALTLVKTASCQNTHSVDLSWGASPTVGALYNVKRSAATHGVRTTIATALAALKYTDSNLQGNTSACYAVTAITNDTTESVESNEVCIQTPKDKALPAGSLVATPR